MILVRESKYNWYIGCVACKWHQIPKRREPGSTWNYNGNPECPTFTPSVNECINPTESPHHNPRVPMRRCHYIITNGMIAYCGDCTHEYAGKTVPMIECPEGVC